MSPIPIIQHYTCTYIVHTYVVYIFTHIESHATIMNLDVKVQTSTAMIAGILYRYHISWCIYCCRSPYFMQEVPFHSSDRPDPVTPPWCGSFHFLSALPLKRVVKGGWVALALNPSSKLTWLLKIAHLPGIYQFKW